MMFCLSVSFFFVRCLTFFGRMILIGFYLQSVFSGWLKAPVLPSRWMLSDARKDWDVPSGKRLHNYGKSMKITIFNG